MNASSIWFIVGFLVAWAVVMVLLERKRMR